MSATQSAHYLVDKDGKVHPADVWSLVESSKPTRIDRWEIPTRWRVQYRPCPTFEGMTYWAVLAPGAVMPVARFVTHAEALDYADRQARTVEVVLPRITDDREEGVADWPDLRDLFVWPGQHDEPRLGQPYLRIADDYRDVDVELHDLRPLAGVLLAYAEQEGVE